MCEDAISTLYQQSEYTQTRFCTVDQSPAVATANPYKSTPISIPQPEIPLPKLAVSPTKSSLTPPPMQAVPKLPSVTPPPPKSVPKLKPTKQLTPTNNECMMLWSTTNRSNCAANASKKSN
eukprot:TRINITY_DN2839_c0_g1_i6.p2 TRINITY_DN2839_c0_g1~~TRINITY_DN2839_c0_g1_i6.p2  ORF type:complete len:121 (-),score=17.20 TRINITY_DN2839_c0_g1_i6:524-886(-)